MLAPDAIDVINPLPAGRPARRFLRWCALAWRMFRAAPLRLFALTMLPMALELVLQLAIPVAGVVLSKLLVPMASSWCLLVTDQRARGGRFGMRQAASRLLQRPRALMQVALMSAGVFCFQVLLACLLSGPTAALGMVTANPAMLLQLSLADIACVLAFGMLPAMLLFFTVPRMLLDHVSLGAALHENWRLLGLGWRPLLLYTLVLMLLIAGFVYQPWLLLLVMPLGYVSYWAYRDTFDLIDAD